jgi:release factor glutamine methyltransferase
VLRLRDEISRAGKVLASVSATPLLDSRLLLAQVLGVEPEELHWDMPLESEVLEKFHRLLQRRQWGEPIAKIRQQKYFWDDVFWVNKHVLDPRPDSETLVEAVVEDYRGWNRPLKILELGVGSGCLLLTLLKIFPQARGVGVDISRYALRVASRNTDRLQLSERVVLCFSYWNRHLPSFCDGEYDLMVANPPYVSQAEWQQLPSSLRRQEPRLALVGGGDGLNNYRYFARHLARNLKDSGRIYLEIGVGQERFIARLFEMQGFRLLGQRRDLHNIIRVLVLGRYD